MFSPSLQSPFVPLQIPRRSPRRQARQRTIAPKRVYGKRKAHVPRAVFEDENTNGINANRENDDDVERSVIGDVEERLTAVRIGSPKRPKPGNRIEHSKKIDSDIEEPIRQVRGNPTPVESEIPQSQTVESLEEENGKKGTGRKGGTQPSLGTSQKNGVEEIEAKMVEVRITTKPKLKGQPDNESRKERQPEMIPTPEKKSRRKQAPRVSTGCIQDVKTNAYVQPILEEVMSAARSVQKFSSWATRAGDKFEVEKIAEGSYGEVYQLHLREDAIPKGSMSKSKLAKLRAYNDGVFKIVPVRAQSGVGSKKFTTVSEIVSEVQLLKLLDPIPGFARFREIHVVQGRFPHRYQAAWWKYRDTKDDCLNPDPAKKASYPDTQLWAILEMDNAGCELEKFAWSSTFQIYDIFWGVAMALARAEQFACFEHRDLHLGNVCVKSTRPDGNMHDPVRMSGEELKQSNGFGISGIGTTIIDYSLSRAELTPGEDPGQWSEITASDLDKKKIFDSVGRDEDEKLLRNTYRYMRAELYKGDPLDPDQAANIPGQWELYSPRTNLIWLLFLLINLLKNRKPEPGHQTPRQPLAARQANKKLNNKQSKSGKEPLLDSYDTENTHVPSNEVDESQIAATSELQAKLLERLHAVRELLDLEEAEESMCCAGDLVAFAIDSQWLEENDFICCED